MFCSLRPTSCSAGLGFISSYSFVGSCTFSCPYLLGGDVAAKGFSSSGTSVNRNNENDVYERAFLALLSSSGALLIYGEDVPTSRHLCYSAQHQAPAIGVFEKMINISETDGLVFGGNLVASDDSKTIKRKLSLNNTDYVICPTRDGCTLT